MKLGNSCSGADQTRECQIPIACPFLNISMMLRLPTYKVLCVLAACSDTQLDSSGYLQLESCLWLCRMFIETA